MTTLNKDIKLPYHKHDYQVASIRVKFNESKESFDNIWLVCGICLKEKIGLNNKILRKLWRDNEYDIEVRPTETHTTRKKK